MPSVTLPPKRPGEANVLVSNVRSIVVVGANGSGKTRLGAFVEREAREKAHRISAQRSLSIPISVQPRAYEQAVSTLHYGSYQPTWDQGQRVANRQSHRWGSEPDTHMLDDYEHVLALLFADEARRNREYARAALQAIPGEHPARCKLDALATIWSAVMPQRTLVVTDDRVQAKSASGPTYEARQMSDGERVAIYLMGQALCAPADGIIIIDEPEIHLHRAIQGLLWDRIETARADCTFVYITHDLEFAATRIGARRIWLKEYDGKAWTWDEIGAASVLPDALTMQVLGSRRPILFVEGDETSHDAAIYGALFPNEHVVPRQSSDKVIEATKAMTGLAAMHHLTVRGLVDRDRRGADEIAALTAAGVSVADAAEVENLLCIPEALAAVVVQLKSPSPQAAIEAAQTAVLDELRKQRGQQALARALAQIQFRLNGFGPKIGKSDAAMLEVELNAFVRAIDVAAIVAESRSLFDDVLARGDYEGALRFFNCKGMVAFVARAFGLTSDVYTGIVMGMLKEQPNGPVAEAMRMRIGVLS